MAVSLAIACPNFVEAQTSSSLWTMGRNRSGQLGDGTTTERHTPLQIASGVKAVAGGIVADHSLFVTSDGALFGMGSNYYGELGIRTTTYDSYKPVKIASGVTAIAAGGSYSLFVKTDGTLWGMGYNSNGQLGDGTTTVRYIPVPIASNVMLVAAGVVHSLFVKTDGTLWAMGKNGNGQLGDGTTIERHTPVQIASGVKAIAVGGYFSLFVKTDGTLWAVGENGKGQLGDGTTTERHTPVQIASGVKAIAAGSNHSLFVKTNGTLWGMGWGTVGELGDGTATDRLTPIQIASNVTLVAAGGAYSLFVKTDGTLWAMGENDYGQLGDGTTTIRLTPIQIASGVNGVAAGYGHSLFLRVDPFITQQPQDQVVALGTRVTLSVSATSNLRLSYQWRKEGVNIPRATSASYPIAFMQQSDVGDYDVVVTNSFGSVTSSVAALASVTASVDWISPNAAGLSAFANSHRQDAEFYFVYGKTGDSLSVTPPQFPGASITNVSATLSNLLPATSYRFRPVMIFKGYLFDGPDQFFTTPAAGMVLSNGIYNGLVLSGTDSNDGSGFFSGTITATGAFSGTLLFSGMSYPLMGIFDTNGRFTQTIARPSQSSLILELQLDVVNHQITGTVSDGAIVANVNAMRASYTATVNPAPQAGKYTVLLPSNPLLTGTAYPQGNGYLLLNVTTAGLVTATGQLGDGTPVSAGGVLVSGSNFPFYAGLYGTTYPFRGSLIGSLVFHAGGAQNDCDGRLDWFKPVQSSGVYYPQGFTGSTDAIGSRYTIPAKGVQVLNLPATTGNAQVELGVGNLAATLDKTITLSPTNLVTVVTLGSDKLTMKIAPSTGMFTGGFTDSTSLKTRKFSGVLMQKQVLGGGLFLGTNQTGYVEILPIK